MNLTFAFLAATVAAIIQVFRLRGRYSGCIPGRRFDLFVSRVSGFVRTVVAMGILTSVVIAAERSPEWQARYKQAAANATKAYPAAGVKGSVFYNAVRAEVARCERDEPGLFDNPVYPLIIAERAAEALGTSGAATAGKSEGEWPPSSR